MSENASSQERETGNDDLKCATGSLSLSARRETAQVRERERSSRTTLGQRLDCTLPNLTQ